MLQEVFDRDGKRVFHTEIPEVMYSKEIAKSMREGGFIVKMDGKVWPTVRKSNKELKNNT